MNESNDLLIHMQVFPTFIKVAPQESCPFPFRINQELIKHISYPDSFFRRHYHHFRHRRWVFRDTAASYTKYPRLSLSQLSSISSSTICFHVRLGLPHLLLLLLACVQLKTSQRCRFLKFPEMTIIMPIRLLLCSCFSTPLCLLHPLEHLFFL